jgi:hypothetical protein
MYLGNDSLFFACIGDYSPQNMCLVELTINFLVRNALHILYFIIVYLDEKENRKGTKGKEEKRKEGKKMKVVIIPTKRVYG